MKIHGYKAFHANKTNRYGTTFEEGKSYHENGVISFGNNGNGFHICTHLSDVFRFFDPDDIAVAKVIGSGKNAYGEMMDWTEPYYDMYSVSDLYIEKFLTREEIINIMLRTNESDIVKLFATCPLNEGEAIKLLRQFRNSDKVVSAFLYYYIGLATTYYMEPKERHKKLEKVYGDGQNSNKRSQGK